MIIVSMDMVEMALPMVSAIGSGLMNLTECTPSPLAEAIEGWSRKRTRWRNVKNKVKGGRRRVHCAMTALVACPAGVSGNHNVVHFDTDSFKIGMDNRCSARASHKIGDFVGNTMDSNETMRGFGGTRTKTLECGTLMLKWLDDDGLEHKFKMPNSYCVPEGEMRLLSQQHWAKEIGKP